VPRRRPTLGEVVHSRFKLTRSFDFGRREACPVDGRLDEARAAPARALALARGRSVVHCHLGLGQLYRRTGAAPIVRPLRPGPILAYDRPAVGYPAELVGDPWRRAVSA